MAEKKQDQIGCIEAGILENALVIIAVLDKKGKILAWNRAAETITGYTKQEVIGSAAIWRLMYPDKAYRDSVTSRIEKILAAKDYFENFETTIHTRSGSSRVILWNTKEINLEGMSRIVAVGQDITHVRELDAFRENIIDNANVLISILDLHGKVVMWNKAAEEITGYPRAEAIGRHEIWKQLYPDKDYRDTVTRQIKEVISSKRHFANLETSVTTKSGEKRIISWNTRQIEFSGGHHVIAIGVDITERKAEKALVAYMTEMAMRMKQPVEIIRDNLRDVAELIRMGKLTPEETAMLLDGQVRNATQITANVQEFQKAIAERNQYIPEAYREFLKGD